MPDYQTSEGGRKWGTSAGGDEGMRQDSSSAADIEPPEEEPREGETVAS